MVVNPRKYQRVWAMGVESLLNHLYAASQDFVVRKFNRKKFYQEISLNNKLTSEQFSSLFYELKRNKYIETDNSEHDLSIKLTNKAKMKIVDDIAAKQNICKKFCFVSFDIPERLHLQRDKFRSAIKRMGFRQIQQSLWVSNKNLGDLVDDAALEYDVSEYVAYIISDTSNINDHVKNALHQS